MSERPNFIRQRMEIEEAAGEGDLRAAYAPFGRTVGLARLGINLETLNLQPSEVSAVRRAPSQSGRPRRAGPR